MDILAAIKREERKLEKQFSKVQRQLNGVRAAAKHRFPTGDIETVLAEIEQGYLTDRQS